MTRPHARTKVPPEAVWSVMVSEEAGHVLVLSCQRAAYSALACSDGKG